MNDSDFFGVVRMLDMIQTHPIDYFLLQYHGLSSSFQSNDGSHPFTFTVKAHIIVEERSKSASQSLTAGSRYSRGMPLFGCVLLVKADAAVVSMRYFMSWRIDGMLRSS